MKRNLTTSLPTQEQLNEAKWLFWLSQCIRKGLEQKKRRHNSRAGNNDIGTTTKKRNKVLNRE